jgi:hypothetical protein
LIERKKGRKEEREGKERKRKIEREKERKRERDGGWLAGCRLFRFNFSDT